MTTRNRPEQPDKTRPCCLRQGCPNPFNDRKHFLPNRSKGYLPYCKLCLLQLLVLVCHTCGQCKAVDKFGKYTRDATQRRGDCKECVNKRRRGEHVDTFDKENRKVCSYPFCSLIKKAGEYGTQPQSQFPLNPKCGRGTNKDPHHGLCLTCITNMTHKRCSTKEDGCGALKEKSKFGADINNPDQLNSKCNACVSKRQSKKQKLAGKDAGKYKTALRDLIKSKCLRTTVATDFVRDVLKTTHAAFRQYIEERFKEGMTWENYNTEWQMDHILAKTLFQIKYEDTMNFPQSHPRLWHYTNLQPLTLLQNGRGQKSNKTVIPLADWDAHWDDENGWDFPDSIGTEVGAHGKFIFLADK